MDNQGYLIARKPEYLIRRFEQSERIRKCPKEYGIFCKAFAKFNRMKYRGISRDPLEAYPSLDEKVLTEYASKGIDISSNKEARIKMLEIIPEMTVDYYDDCFIRSYTDATEIYGMLEDPERWEIIRIKRNVFEKSKSTLGFDVGYWGGDHFSLIADTIIIPSWHSPDEEDYTELAEKLSILNEQLLFDSFSQAKNFKEYYKSKEWAETESLEGDFCIIQVDKVIIE